MRPERGRDQAATQVKGLNPENPNIREADTLHDCGRQDGSGTVRGEVPSALAGSETAAWDQEDGLGTWETQGVTQWFGLRSDKL